MADAGTIKASIDFDANGLEAAVNKAMSRATKQIGTQIDTSMDKAEGRIKHGFRRTGVLLAGFLGLEAISGKIVEAGTYIATLGQKYESTLNEFQAVSGATAQEMSKVSSAAKELGNDITIPGASAADAAEAMTELAKGGMSVQESMDAAQGTLRLAAAAQIEAADAATIQSSALNAFRLSADKASMVADVLANGANASAAEIGDMADALSQAGAVANAAGLSIQETTTFLAQFANAGIKGSDAGTLLKSMLMALRAPSGVAAKEMERLGLSVFDANGNMVNGEEITKRLIAATEGMTEADRAAALGKIFGADAIRGVNILLDQGIKGHRETAEAMRQQGSAAEVAAAKSKGLGGAINGLVSIAESLAIEIYEAVAPAMDKWLRGSLEKIPGVLEDAETYVKALLHALEPAAQIVGDFIAAAKPGAVVAFKAALAALLGVAQGLGMILGPIAETINDNQAAFKAIIAPLVAATLAYKAFARVTTSMRGMRSEVVAGVTKQVERYKTAMNGATTATSKFRVIGGGLVGAMGGPWGLAIGAATMAIGFFAQKNAEARSQVDQMKSSLNQQTGALTKNSREWAAKRLREEGALEIAKELGISLPLLTSAVLGEKQAVAQVNRVLDGFTKQTDKAEETSRHFAAGLGVGSVALGEERVAAGQLRNTLGDLTGQVKQATREKKLEIEATKSAKRAKDQDSTATATLSRHEQKLKGDTYATNKTLREQENQAKDTTRAIKGLNNAAVEGMNAQIDFEQAADDLRKQIKSLTPKVRESGKALDITTQQGRDTMRSFVDLASASSKVEGGMAQARKQIFNAARELGATKPEARALTRQFFELKGSADRVPGSVRVKVSAPGAAGTKAAIDSVRGAALLTERTYDIKFRYIMTGQIPAHGGPIVRAQGGPVLGPGTGTSDSIPAMLSNGEHVFTAREVDAAGGHTNIMRIRKAILAGAVKFAGGGGLDLPGRPASPQVSLRDLDKASSTSALVENLSVSVGDKRDLPEALDETMFHLRRIRRGGRYAAV